MTYPGLDQRATVYTPGPSGDYSVVARTGLACRLALVSADGAGGGAERAELLKARLLLWQEDYVLPEDCQIEVDGQRWNPRTETQAIVYLGVGPGRIAHHRHCDVVEAGT